MIRRLALLSILVVSATGATLQFTLPTHLVTVAGECSGSDSVLADLAGLDLWGFSVLGGEPRPMPLLVRSKTYPPGREGSTDTLQVEPDYVYYIVTRRANGKESCPSPAAYVAGIITGAGDHATPKDWVVSRKVFDVHGRVVTAGASGIYFVREVWKSGRATTRKRVVVK